MDHRRPHYFPPPPQQPPSQPPQLLQPQQPFPPPPQQPQQYDPNLLNYFLQNPFFQQPPSYFPPPNPNFSSYPQQPPPFFSPNPSVGGGFTQQQQQEPPPPGKGNVVIRPNKFPLPQKVAPTVNSERREMMAKIDAAVVAVRREMVAAKEHVSAWKVSQAVLVRLKVDSWDTLGFSMQEIPSLRQLLLIEGKINAFIHCHVAAQRITSLFDLQEAMCKNEGVEKFEELELGPLLRHPLVIHYFSISKDVEEIYEITSEKLVTFLSLCVLREHYKVEEFLDFVAKKCKVTSWQKLGVRIQSLGMHIGFLKKARGAQNHVLKKYEEAGKGSCDKARKKRPLFSLQKKELDDRFSTISQRVTSFASQSKDVSGQHVRFGSSSSDELDDVTDSSDGEQKGGNACESSAKCKSGDRVSSCPYPSVAEEMSRLGLRGEMCEFPSPSHQPIEPAKKKTKRQRDGKEIVHISEVVPAVIETKRHKRSNYLDQPQADDSIRMFITTWKDACRGDTAAELLEKIMEFCNFRKGQRNLIRKAFSKHPFVGLLNVAVTSIKRGMWDSMYDTFQFMGALGHEHTVEDKLTELETIDIQPIEIDADLISKGASKPALCVSTDNIFKKASEYLAGSLVLSGGSTLLDRVLVFVKQLCQCENWLSEQFSVSDFKLLGQGDFWSFLGKNLSILPKEVLDFLSGEAYGSKRFEVSMVQKQLVLLLSQASKGLWGEDDVTKEKLSEVLKRQFPHISFKTPENYDFKEVLDCVTSSSVIFSAALLGPCNYAEPGRVISGDLLDNSELIVDTDHMCGFVGSVTSKDAIEVLLKAPFLSDLNSWCHWDSIYAPSLGPLFEWMMNEVNVPGLQCLLTSDCKIIRIDHSASVELFFQALIQESPHQVAVQLISLLALFGGRRHVPLSLLKCQARQGFEVLLANRMENMGFRNGLGNEKTLREHHAAGCNSSISKNSSRAGEGAMFASRIVIDCIALLPPEFRCFAADVLLSGLRSLVKDAALVLLLQINRTQERVMLHEIGFSLGILEWINDHHTHCPLTDSNSATADEAECPDVKTFSCDLSSAHKLPPFAANKDGQCSTYTSVCSTSDSMSVVDSEIVMSHQLAEQGFNEEEAAVVIESIRREEFGLDLNISDVESGMLKKQHARLGRALHCLSQELYSQDSHFLLELVQNADDNVYPDNVEPTLCFILLDTGIIVLNNERGFTAKNIRALCDVGNSTKKGSAGYIGQKGIGFKSVFRVTDAPEIHSNGFHIKFDISEGQIGFVLPTVVPPCDIDKFNRLASGGTIQERMHCWNTCIVLPFKSKLREGTCENSISSMLSDLKPLLLLFLHRLQCIKLRNMLENTHIFMRKEILGDGIVEVSDGKEKMTCLVASEKLHPRVSRLNVHMTEISIAFTLEETVDGDYRPILSQQCVFAFLPLRAYGLKFILQGDFILPSSREEVDEDSPWNQWLLSEFPGLFVSAEKLFCSLSCFQENLARAVSAYMSFVPLMGEVHGFFSVLPWQILSKLRQSNCLLENGHKDKWVAPCKVLRGWNDQAQLLLPDALLYEHLGLGLLHKDINLPDTLARALGVEEYGPKILVRFLSSLAHTKDGIKSMGLGWLFSFVNELHSMCHSYEMNLSNSGLEEDLISCLKKVPFIPLSNGTYGSLDEGTIWLHADYVGAAVDSELGHDAFPYLYATLRIVNPALFSEASGDVTLLNNCSRMLQKIGVQPMSAHELIIIHILPSMSDELLTVVDPQLLTEYLIFFMLHLRSNCFHCQSERKFIMSQLRRKALVLTNYGYKRLIDAPIHFSGEYGNPVDAKKFLNGLDYKWHEVDRIYLDHPLTKLMSSGLIKWRDFFQELGVTDFVKIDEVEKSIADASPTVLNQIICDRDLISPGVMLKDWECPELLQILSLLSKDGHQQRCRHLLEVLDALWDDNFSDKVLGHCASSSGRSDLSFKSSLLHCLSDNRWVVSSLDGELHYPRELFYDCDAVRSIFGYQAPYAVPKIRSFKLLKEIGFKSQVTLDDVLAMLQTWRSSKSPFEASLTQMSKFYTFVWKEKPTSRQQVVDALSSGPYIFVPNGPVKYPEDVVAGVFLSPGDVYWHDSTGAVDHSKNVDVSMMTIGIPLSKTLCSLYQGLHDFFVSECGVNEAPSFHQYIQILQQLSRDTLPSQAANAVFQVLLSWSDGLKCDGQCPDDLNFLKECLSQLDFTVLPAIQDKWVSLHPSFGLICWSDNDNLKKEFKHLDNIDFLFFGELTDNEKELLHTRVSVLLKKLGIPSLSEVVSREAIYYGLLDSELMTSMIGWVLPFAQRYVYNLHPEKYGQLKLSGFSGLHDLRVVVVEKLFYRNVIQRCNCTSKKRSECSSLLQGSILYTTQESDPHSLFLELTRLFFDGNPELHLANFLHMITTMMQSGSTEEQIEFFVLNSQKMGQLPGEESVWSLSSGNDDVLLNDAFSTRNSGQGPSNSKRKPVSSSWPPADWKTAPGFSYAHRIGIKTQPVIADQGGNVGTSDGVSGDIVQDEAEVTLKDDIVIEDDGVIDLASTVFPIFRNQSDHVSDLPQSSIEVSADPANISFESLCPEEVPSKSSGKDQLLSNTPGAKQALQTGRQGELVAYRFFTKKGGGVPVTWVNENKETGLPYDIVVGEDEASKNYIEVKASRYARKDWFEVSAREWQFAVEKGDSFSIAHVTLSSENARILVYKNPVKLCQLGKLQLAVMTPRSYQVPPTSICE